MDMKIIYLESIQYTHTIYMHIPQTSKQLTEKNHSIAQLIPKNNKYYFLGL